MGPAKARFGDKSKKISKNFTLELYFINDLNIYSYCRRVKLIKMRYHQNMELTITLLIVFYFVFYLLRPTSKSELRRFNKKDNWSNMGF